jgi:hypothetical protein
MLDCQDNHLITDPVVDGNQPWTGKDRRRPGRIQNVNPTLIPLLRNSAEIPTPDDIVPDHPEAFEYARRKALLVCAALRVSPWRLIALWIVITTAIRFMTGHGSWIAFFGGVILSLCLCIFSSCEVLGAIQ